MGEPLVTVLIVNYNGVRHLPACLAALATQTLPRHRFEVVVVDNASRDGSVDLLRRGFPWVRVVLRRDNAGFAGGNNAGLPFARGRYLVLLNNDTAPDSHWLSELVSSAQPGCAAASKLVFTHDPGLVNSAGLDLLRDGRGADRGFRQRDRGQFERGGPVFAGCGAAVLFDTEAIDGPLFEPRYFVYYEDLDTFWRGQLAAVPTRYAPRSLVRHVHGGSAGEESPLFRYHVERNRALTSLRNGDLFLAATALFGLAARAARSAAKWLLGRERGRMAWATVRAFLAFLLFAPAVLAERYTTREWAGCA